MLATLQQAFQLRIGGQVGFGLI